MRPGRLQLSSADDDEQDDYWAGLEERPADFHKDSVTVRDGFRWRHFSNEPWEPDEPEPRALWLRCWDTLFSRRR